MATTQTAPAPAISAVPELVAHEAQRPSTGWTS